MAAGLPIEGELAGVPRAATVARTDVPTCSLGEGLGEVRERVLAAGWDTCVVVNEHRIVLGILRKKQFEEGDASAPAEAAMRPGPSTFRPNVPIAEMAEFMSEHDLADAPITKSLGELLGLLLRDDAIRVAREWHDEQHRHGGEGDG